MPIQRCRINGRKGYRYGQQGKCYTGPNGRAKAEKQAAAIRASGYTENEDVTSNRRHMASGGCDNCEHPEQAGLWVNHSLITTPPKALGRDLRINQSRGANQQPNPIKSDPTRTSLLRRKFEREFSKRFARLRSRIIDLIAKEDALGLRDTLVGNLDFASTQVNLTDPEVSRRIGELQQRLDKRDVLEFEDQPHVTVRYGLHTQDAEPVQETIRDMGPILVRLGRLSLFQNDKQDVLKLEVHSKGLEQLNQQLALLPHTDTHAEYNPHLTVAYLKPGTGAKYLQELSFLEELEFWFNRIYFSDKDRNHTPITLNTRWRFRSDPEKIKAFADWLENQIVLGLIPLPSGNVDDAYWQAYVEEGYRKGAGRAFDDVRKAEKATAKLDFYKGTKQQFLRSAFGRPESIAKVKLLASRVFTDLKGVTSDMSARMSRTLTDGLVQGKNPRAIARDLTKVVDISKRRALLIARTEIISAHAQGQLDSMEQLGVTEVGVAVEFDTAGDGRVCRLCQPLEGIVVTIKEAQGMIPRHPG